MPGGQVALPPAVMPVDPAVLETGDRGRRQPRSILAEQGGQRRFEPDAAIIAGTSSTVAGRASCGRNRQLAPYGQIGQ